MALMISNVTVNFIFTSKPECTKQQTLKALFKGFYQRVSRKYSSEPAFIISFGGISVNKPFKHH